jgi:hypothetical protein
MPIERINCGQQGGAYGADWKQVPAISVTGSGITFNATAAAAFKLVENNYLDVSVDTDIPAVLFRKITSGDPDFARGGFFRIRKHSVLSGQRSSFMISTTEIAKRYPHARKCAYRLTLNAGGRVIQADLTKENQIK